MSEIAINEVEKEAQGSKKGADHAEHISRENSLSSVSAADRIKMFLTPGSCVSVGNLTICDSSAGSKKNSADSMGEMERLLNRPHGRGK
jgi:hypothetical protein